MTIQAVADLKAKFEAGDLPSGQDFIDLIDTLLDIDSQWPATLSAADGSNLTNLTLPDPLPPLNAEQLYNLTPNEWYGLVRFGPTYADATSFVLTGDHTALFPLDKRIRLTVAGAYEYTTPLTATYDAIPDATTVTINDAMSDVTLTLVEVSVFNPFNAGGSISPEMVGIQTVSIPAAGTDIYTAAPGYSEYIAGKTYPVSFANTNTDPAPTINFDALGAKTIKNLDGSALVIGAIPDEAFCRYDGTDMILLNPLIISGPAFVASQFGGEYIKLSDVKTPGSQGGTFTAGAWQTRTLNTEDSDTGGNCALAANQFTLDAGTYNILATAPVLAVEGHQARIANITDSTYIKGTCVYANAGNSVGNISVAQGQFTIASAKVFELQHWCNSTGTTSGFGTSVSTGTNEIFSVVELWKVK